MQVALRKCDFDPIGMKAVPNRQKNRVLDIANPIFGIIDPHPQLQINRTVAIFQLQDISVQGSLKYGRCSWQRLHGKGDCLFQIRPIGDAKGYVKAYKVIVVR